VGCGYDGRHETGQSDLQFAGRVISVTTDEVVLPNGTGRCWKSCIIREAQPRSRSMSTGASVCCASTAMSRRLAVGVAGGQARARRTCAARRAARAHRRSRGERAGMGEPRHLPELTGECLPRPCTCSRDRDRARGRRARECRGNRVHWVPLDAPAPGRSMARLPTVRRPWACCAHDISRRAARCRPLNTLAKIP